MSESNSLERMLAVLNLFAEPHLEWTSEEMMVELGYSRPTLYRYIRTLRQNGLLVSLNSATFTLGPKVVEMDFLMRRSDLLVLEAKPVLQALTVRYPCTAFVSRWYRTKVLCVESASSSSDLVSSYPRGRPMPLGRGATSRAILAFLPARQAEPLIEANLAEFQAAGFGETVKEILPQLRAIRKAGVAVAWGEVTEGVVGFASPIFDAGRTPIASLSLIFDARMAQGDIEAQIGETVRVAAADLSARLSDKRAEISNNLTN